MIRLMFLGAAALMLAASPAAAVTVYKTILSGANEVPPNASTASGTGTLLLSFDKRIATVSIDFANLSAPLAAGHAHCCALPGANVRVAIDFAPLSATSGSFTRVVNLTLASTYTAGFINNNGGTAASAQAAFLAGLDGGRVYFNLHNSAFPGGEIRGNLNAVPEPSSWAMLIAGFGLVGAAARRRRVAVA